MENICLLTSYNEYYKEISKITIPNMLYYCEKHNLDFYKTERDFTNGRPWVWNKLIFIQKILPLYDWVVCIDTDCLFINTNIDLRKFIDNDYSIVIGENYSPDNWFTEFNTNLEFGVSFIKNTNYSYKILEEVFINPIDSQHPWAEQYCLMKLLQVNPEFNKQVKRINMDMINTLPKRFISPENTLLYHCAGGSSLPIKIKESMLKDILREVII